MSAWPKFQVIYLILMEWGEWEEPGGCTGHSILPTLLTSWLWEPHLKNFWFLNFTFPFTWYIRFWHFCSFPYIAMCGLLLFSQQTLQFKQGNSLIKKKITECKMMQNASTSNATKFKKKQITPSRDTCVWSFNAALHQNSFCEGWHLLLPWVTFSFCKFVFWSSN